MRKLLTGSTFRVAEKLVTLTSDAEISFPNDDSDDSFAGLLSAMGTPNFELNIQQLAPKIYSPNGVRDERAEADAQAVKEPAKAEPAKAEASGPLPDDFPGRAALEDAGIDTFEEVRDVDDLTTIPGVGAATAAKIKEALNG